MLEIQPISLSVFPFINIKEVGVLLFSYYPTTIIYADENNNPIIKEWVDCSDDNKIDRFFYYRSSKVLLKQFIEGEISHLELINSSLDNYVIFQDQSEEVSYQPSLLSLKDLPQKYKPASTFMFDSRDGVETGVVIEFFKLDEIEPKVVALEKAKNISVSSSNETYYIRIKKGKGVGLGTINTDVFGKTLLNLNKLYKNVALDYLLGSNRGDIDIDAKKNEDYAPYTETIIYADRIAASYGFLVRPVVLPQTNLFNNQTETQQIAIKTFNLIGKSADMDSFKEEYMLHSGYTINSYRQFLEIILKEKLDMDLNWFNPFNNDEINDTIDYHKASKIINDIESLSTTSSNEFKAIGKFRAVNCDTRHYSFFTLNEQPYTGYFDKLLKEGLVKINFIDIYEITISRKILVEVDKKGERVADTIIAYYEDKKD